MVCSMIWPMLLLVTLLTSPSEAETISATTCSASDVQSAVNSARAGDTVTVPSGSCTWTVPVDINAKRITLVGGGIGVTTITDQAPNGSGPANGALLVRHGSAGNFVDISGFTFIKDTPHPSGGIINIQGLQENIGFRVHHMRFIIPSSYAAGIYVVGLYGLIDHVTFDVTATSGSIHAVEGFGGSGASDGGFGPWMQPSAMGTNRAIFIEDSQITSSAKIAGIEVCIDGFAGVRYVIRYNTFTNCSPGFHGTDSGFYRSAVSVEMYNNKFINNSSVKLRGFVARGGTGVIYNNTYSSTTGWDGYVLQLFRMPKSGLPTSNWQSCNGSNWEIGSANYSNPNSRISALTGSPTRVKFCSGNRDIVCTEDASCASAGAGKCTTYFDGDGIDGYPCRDQVGRGSGGQISSPWYEWNNTGRGGVPVFEVFPSTKLIRPNRDYFANTSPPGYSSFVYPHPLQMSNLQTSSQEPLAPANLSIR